MHFLTRRRVFALLRLLEAGERTADEVLHELERLLGEGVKPQPVDTGTQLVEPSPG